MIELVITGGQTGADLGGWKAAKAADIATTGWMPRGFQTEDGAQPDYRQLYGARPLSTANYPDRTRKNVMEAVGPLDDDGVGRGGAAIVFNRGLNLSPGTKLLQNIAGNRLPILLVCVFRDVGYYWTYDDTYSPTWIADWLHRIETRRLLIAGNRESRAAGIERFVESWMGEVFRVMREKEID